MKNVNWGRFVLGALIVAAICFVSDGFLHQKVVSEQWEAVVAALGGSFKEHQAGRWFISSSSRWAVAS